MSASWTVMVYLAGNNSLSGAAAADLREMRQVGSTEQVKMLAFVKQRSRPSAYHLQIGKGHDDVADAVGPVDSGDPQTVVNFIRWGIQKAPADRYALVLWNHGGGWLATDIKQLYSQVRGTNRVTRAEINHRGKQRIAQATFSKTVKTIMALPTVAAREICSDDTSTHSLDTIEVENILRLMAQEIKHPVDLFGMDACLMSTLEVAYQVRDHVRVVVGSEELEPNAGWDYRGMLTDLNGNAAMDAPELARAIVARYVESYRNHPTEWPVTQAAVDPARADALLEAVDALAKALLAQPSSRFLSVFQAHMSSIRFERDLVDLRSFCRNLLTVFADSSITTAAKAVIEALRPGGYVISEGHLGDQVEGCGGVSLYAPSPSDPISRYYDDLRFAQDHHWDDLLLRYQRGVRGG